MQRRAKRSFGLLTAAVMVMGLVSVPQFAVAQEDPADAVPDAHVEGPVGEWGIHGRPWHTSTVPVEPHGFVEEEYFFSGPTGDTGELEYKTRMIVRRPVDGTFSGTVFVDWINVTGGRDLETMWPPAVPVYLEERHAYVGLTTQLAGVAGLRAWDALRYFTLFHPGSSADFDILAQAVKAIRSPVAKDPLGGLDVEYVIVGGASQSAGRLTSYITEGNPIEGLIDGFYISRGGGGQSIKDIAEDLQVPMLKTVEENLTGPADSQNWVVWEGAGQGHAPKSWHDNVWAISQRDLAQGQADWLRNPVDTACAVNRGTVQYQARAATHWLNRWVRDGTPAPSAPRVERDEEGSLVRDEDGNVVGGLRYPFIEVPLGEHSNGGCPLFGFSRLWTKEKILERYPTHEDYYSRVEAHVNHLLGPTAGPPEERGGWLLPGDAAEILEQAAALDIWNGGSCWNAEAPVEGFEHDWADESGPVSSQLRSQRGENTPVGLGVGAAIGNASCTFAALGL